MKLNGIYFKLDTIFVKCDIHKRGGVDVETLISKDLENATREWKIDLQTALLP